MGKGGQRKSVSTKAQVGHVLKDDYGCPGIELYIRYPDKKEVRTGH